jgi:hypothetical protein
MARLVSGDVAVDAQVVREHDVAEAEEGREGIVEGVVELAPAPSRASGVGNRSRARANENVRIRLEGSASLPRMSPLGIALGDLQASRSPAEGWRLTLSEVVG